MALLSEAFWKTRLETQVRRDTARVARETAQEAITRLDRQIADLVVAEDLLAETDAIERLREGLAADRKARKFLPAEEANLRQALASIRDLLAESWPHLLSELSEDEEPVTSNSIAHGIGMEADLQLDRVLKLGEQLRLTRAKKPRSRHSPASEPGFWPSGNRPSPRSPNWLAISTKLPWTWAN